MGQDDEHLKLLSIFHYVLAGIAGLLALIAIFDLIIGLFFILAPDKIANGGELPPAWFGWLFVIGAGLFLTLALILVALVLMEGHFLARRRHRLFCLVVAGIECIFMPFGTALGVFTIIVLTRESAKQLFAATGALERSAAGSLGSDVAARA